MGEYRSFQTTLRSAPVLITVALGLLLTGTLWLAATRYTHEHASSLFAQQTREISRDIQQHLDIHAEVLRGMQGFFGNSDEVTQQEFRRYLEQLALQERYPGVQAFAFARRVSGAQRGAYEARLRRERVADFAVHPAAARDEYLVLEYLHPAAENRAWLGFDLLADPARLSAVTRARDSGQMAVSERLSLPGIDDGTAAFCLSAPVYPGGAMPQAQEGRRAALAGTVNLIFRVKDMLAGIISPEQRRQFDLEIYADEAAARADDHSRVIYDSAQDEDGIPHELHAAGANFRYQVHLPLRIADRDWVLVATALPPFELARGSRLVPLLVTAGGLMTTLLLGLIVALVVSGRRRIEARLGASEHRQQALLDTLPDLIWLKDPDGVFLDCNPMFERLFGAGKADILGKTDYDFVDKDLADHFREHDLKAMAAGKPSSNEEWVRFAGDGHRALLETIKTPLRDANGKLVGVLGIGRDITERKRVEDQLAASELHFRTTFEQTAVGLSQIDPVTGRIRLVNRRFAEMVENTPEALVGMSGHDLTHPDDQAEEDRQWARLTRGEIADYTLEERGLTSTGRILWVSVSATLVRDDAGRPLHGQLVVEDISERRQMQQALQALNTPLTGTAFFEHLARALTGLLDTEIAFVSKIPDPGATQASTCAMMVDGRLMPAMEYALAGTPCENVVGKTSCVYPDAVQQLFPADIDLAKLGVVAYAAAPLWDSQQRALGMIGIMSRRPITRPHAVENVLQLMALRAGSELERERQQQDLRDSEEKYRRLVENLGHEYFFYSRAADGSFIYLSPSIEAILGYTPAEFKTGYRSYLTDSPINAEAAGHRQESLRGNPQPVYEVEFWRKDGSRCTLEVTESPVVGRDGKVLAVEGIAHDITARKAAETALKRLNAELEQRVAARTVDLEQARDAAEAASRAKSAFLATMSHEIRTPMNGVMGMIELLAEGKLDEHQREMVDTVRDSSFALLRIIDDILDFSKLEADRLAIEIAPLSIESLVEAVCDGLETVARDKQVDLHLFVAPALPRRLLGDEVRLRQILNNLVGNAIKFSAADTRRGRVAVRAELRGRDDDRVRLDLSVADDGIGLSADEQAGLFQPFAQADATTTRRFGGTGLGLSIVRRLVELMGGVIRVSSAPGEGARFTVSLSLAIAPDLPAARPPQPLLQGLECLLVTPDEDRARDFGAYLADAGARAGRAADALGALREMEALRPTEGWVVIHDTGLDKPPREALLALGAAVAEPHLLLLLTCGERHRPRLEAPGIVSLDISLLHRRALVDAVALAAGRLSTVTPNEAEPLSTAAKSVSAATHLPILVAEDNDTNRKVILHQLDLLGYRAEVAADGEEALARWRHGAYCLILSDLHMPKMDGYALAEAIRREEPAGRRIPIIAFTANILKEDRDRCMKIGMDDFLTKPMQLPMLKAALEKWLTAGTASPKPQPLADGEPPAATEPGLAVLDTAVLAQLLGSNDPATLGEFLDDYLDSIRRGAAELHAAWVTGNLAGVGAAAHILKSSSRSVGALVLGDLCAELETAGQAGDRPAAAALMPQFDAGLTAVIDAIERRGA